MATATTPSAGGSLGSEILTSILVNAVAPLVVFNQLRPHMSELHALMVTALLPLVENIIMLARHRRLDAFGSFILGGMALTGVLVALGGSSKLLLVRESLLGCGIGIAMLGSLLLPRPLAYYLSGHFIAGSDDERRRRFRLRDGRGPGAEHRRRPGPAHLVAGTGCRPGACRGIACGTDACTDRGRGATGELARASPTLAKRAAPGVPPASRRARAVLK
jgi:hypothetical protein